MCDTCGCGQTQPARVVKPGENVKTESAPHHIHSHSHAHEHDHIHDHQHHSHHHEIKLELDIMQRNNLLAERNRGFFEARDIIVINMVSSPGSGKTSILERTIREGAEKKIYVIEGDQQTMLDAERIDKTGVGVVQVNTGNGCHLDAGMVNEAARKLEISEGSLLMIENVGNLVCPALFDLGEAQRVVIISVTEGEDKPLKYPNMFQSSHLCLINKSDLLPYVDFDPDKFREYALRVNSRLEFITLSAKTGKGFKEWMVWLNDLTFVK